MVPRNREHNPHQSPKGCYVPDQRKTVVPAARYSACEIARHMYMAGFTSVAVSGVISAGWWPL